MIWFNIYSYFNLTFGWIFIFNTDEQVIVKWTQYKPHIVIIQTHLAFSTVYNLVNSFHHIIVQTSKKEKCRQQHTFHINSSAHTARRHALPSLGHQMPSTSIMDFRECSQIGKGHMVVVMCLSRWSSRFIQMGQCLLAHLTCLALNLKEMCSANNARN